MPFCSTTLAARVERAECGLLADATRAVLDRRPAAEAFVTPVAGGVATYAGPGSPMNKVAGLGFEGAPDPRELEALEAAFAQRGVPVVVELCSVGDPAVGALLTRRGYTLEGFEDVHGLEVSAPASPASSGAIEVRASEADTLETWLDIVVRAFAEPDGQGVASHESFPRETLERALQDMAAVVGFQRFLAHLDGRPAGGASLRLAEGVAQLCGAATLPEHRRRGVQTELLTRRLALAAQAGCDVAVLTTQPGSKSAQNANRRGFGLLYTRAVLVRSA